MKPYEKENVRLATENRRLKRKLKRVEAERDLYKARCQAEDAVRSAFKKVKGK